MALTWLMTASLASWSVHSVLLFNGGTKFAVMLVCPSWLRLWETRLGIGRPVFES